MGLSDDDSTDFDTGSLSVSVLTGGVAAEYVLGFDASVVTLSGTDARPDAGHTVTVDGLVIGTIAGTGNGRGGNALIVVFNANATVARVEMLVRAVHYENVGSTPTTTPRTLRLTVDDGDSSLSAAQDVTVTIQMPATGTYSDSGQTLGTANSPGVALGDVDGDGDLDMVVANLTQPNKIWLNNGSGE